MCVLSASKVYSRESFARHAEGSAKSATVVVPLVLSLLPVGSVIDVGCGIGPWAAEFLRHGVEDVWGIDGDYVDRSRLSTADSARPVFAPRPGQAAATRSFL